MVFLERGIILLDTNARHKVEGVINHIATLFIRLNWKPTHVTILALVLGLLAGVSYYFGFVWLAILLMWSSGTLDAVDGNMARKTGQASKLGTLMDLLFDRIVEIGFILAIALTHSEAVFSLMILACTFIVSMTMFLTTGNLVKNEGKKSFHYQAGLMERTETFIFFTLMFIFENFIIELSYLFAVLVIYTLVQRFIETKRMIEGE